nr:MAG TPA: hypothetical protein [Caudoviricetes sp.]
MLYCLVLKWYHRKRLQEAFSQPPSPIPFGRWGYNDHQCSCFMVQWEWDCSVLCGRFRDRAYRLTLSGKLYALFLGKYVQDTKRLRLGGGK